ncbi:polyubiquitin-C [Oopsacas minuta]|uniref:Polyubiquitin-C n=1 Tax=Oopsacas minuta TaxID=111878 RepID=A0AAV7KIL2_9METZ|nr:polyubiquitin-C [Oopsacas minuta]
MQIKILTDRNEIIIEVTFTDRIDAVKEKIAEKLGCEIHRQRLSFQGVILEDHKQISQYPISQESSLNLEIRMRLYVKMASMTLDLDCYPSWSISEVKHEIGQKVQVPANNQMLSYKDEELKNNKTVRDYDFRDQTCIAMSGVIMVTVNFPSGKCMRYPFDQQATVFAIKQEVWENERIPTDRQTLNYKGRELRGDQTFSSIRYRDGDNIYLAIQHSPADIIQVFVKTPIGQKRFISISKYEAVGRIEDKVGFQLEDLFSHICYYKGKVLDDVNVVEVYNIQQLAELELRSCEDRIPVFVILASGTVSSFYVKPSELVSDVTARIRSKLHVPNEHRKLYHNHRLLPNDQIIRNCDMIPGDNLLFGTDDSFSITVYPSGIPVDILVRNTDRIKDLKYQVERREKIPFHLQEFTFQGSILDNEQLVSSTQLRCGTMIILTIISNPSNMIDVKLFDLSKNKMNIAGNSEFSTVGNLQNRIAFSEQDVSFVFKDIVMKQSKLLSNYGIRHESEILVVSANYNILAVPPSNTNRSHYTGTTPAENVNYDSRNQFPVFNANYQDGASSHLNYPYQQHQQPDQPPYQSQQQQTHIHQQQPQYHQQPRQHTNFSPQHSNIHQQHTNFPPQQPQYHQQPRQHTNFPPQQTNIHQQQTNFPPQQTNIHQQHTNFPPQQTNIHQQQTNFPPQQTNIHQQQTNFPPQQTQFPQQQPQNQNTYPQQQSQHDTPSELVLLSSLPIPHTENFEQSHDRLDFLTKSTIASKEICMHLSHHVTGTFQVQCTTHESIATLKERIFHHTRIPSSKIHLLHDDQLLSNDKRTLEEYKIMYDRVIKLNDLLRISVTYESNDIIRWVNGIDFVSTLGADIAEELKMDKDNLILTYKDAILDFDKRLNQYQIDFDSKIIAEKIRK